MATSTSAHNGSGMASGEHDLHDRDGRPKPKVKLKPGALVPASNSTAATAANNAVKLARGEPANEQPTSADDTEAAPRAPEDLQQISSIGPVLAGQLHALGIRNIQDIAVWNTDDVKRVSAILAIDGRIDREDWIGQARALIANMAIDSDER